MMDGFTAWKNGVVRGLAAGRGDGLSFEQAWTRALAEHPPRQMEQGPRIPTLEDEESVLDYFRAACADAWSGRRDELRDLPSALEGGLARNWPTVGGRSMLR